MFLHAPYHPSVAIIAPLSCKEALDRLALASLDRDSVRDAVHKNHGSLSGFAVIVISHVRQQEKASFLQAVCEAVEMRKCCGPMSCHQCFLKGSDINAA